MAYLMLIVEPVGQRAERGLEDGREAYARMQAFAAGLEARGALRGVNALKTPATRLQRHGDGGTLVLDGPFAETKEMLGGYFLLDGVTRDEALAIAADCPAAAWATIELRETGTCYE
ncbi:MAG: YciI family protein [Rubrivivax sp.]